MRRLPSSIASAPAGRTPGVASRDRGPCRRVALSGAGSARRDPFDPACARPSAGHLLLAIRHPFIGPRRPFICLRRRLVACRRRAEGERTGPPGTTGREHPGDPAERPGRRAARGRWRLMRSFRRGGPGELESVTHIRVPRKAVSEMQPTSLCAPPRSGRPSRTSPRSASYAVGAVAEARRPAAAVLAALLITLGAAPRVLGQPGNAGIRRSAPRREGEGRRQEAWPAPRNSCQWSSENPRYPSRYSITITETSRWTDQGASVTLATVVEDSISPEPEAVDSPLCSDNGRSLP
jgi:hypothetical protein